LQQRVFVLNFDSTKPKKKHEGQTMENFGEAVSLLVATATSFDEVIVKITCPGGPVSDYGLASSHMLRLKKAGIPTTVCVDTMAASGGYMMACVGDKIVASPFAFLGSIGVVAGVPNVHKVLQKNDIDYLLFTAGKFKRTITMFNETSEEAKNKFQHDLEVIHDAFASHVAANRGLEPGSGGDVATGEAWLALEAVQKGLVDELMTSEEYIRSKMPTATVVEVLPAQKKKPGLREILEGMNGNAARFLSELRSPWGAAADAVTGGALQVPSQHPPSSPPSPNLREIHV
jgi:serine protease SohB